MPTPLPFDLEWVSSLVATRTEASTAFFQACTWLGEVEGYVLIVAAIHVAFDKGLAIRLAVVALTTMSANHVLKTWIANPRPFVALGTHEANWAVSPAKAAELAAEYSTPSGHAMAGASFYGALVGWARSLPIRFLAITAIVLLGVSRPVLGVHYVEDILLGWGLGGLAAVVAIRFGGRIGDVWDRLPVRARLLVVTAVSGVVWFATAGEYTDPIHGRPLPFMRYLGFLTGVLVADPLERRWIGFDPRSGSCPQRLARFALTLSLVGGSLVLMDVAAETITTDGTALADALRFARYAVAGSLGLLGAPALFVRLGLASVSESKAPIDATG